MTLISIFTCCKVEILKFLRCIICGLYFQELCLQVYILHVKSTVCDIRAFINISELLWVSKYYVHAFTSDQATRHCCLSLNHKVLRGMSIHKGQWTTESLESLRRQKVSGNFVNLKKDIKLLSIFSEVWKKRHSSITECWTKIKLPTFLITI